jgi:ABC-2 type transport system ATP-binding protein
MAAPLVVTNFRHSFDAVAAVNGISFSIQEGEIFGLIGPDGAGKTTTMRAMAGLIDPTGGTIRVQSCDPRDRISGVREQLGYMPQRYSLYGDLSVGENLRFFANLFCLNRREFEARKKRLLAITRLDTFVDRRAEALSGGMYKKLALSCALLHQPKVLLLDEPTNGVDPISRIELWDLLYTFLAEGMAIAVSTSYMDEAARCTRVGILHQGNLLAQGTPEEMVDGMNAAVVSVDASIELIETLFAPSPGEFGIISMTPRGHKARLVIAPNKIVGVMERLQAASTHAAPTAAGFEDLFLSTVSTANSEVSLYG